MTAALSGFATWYADPRRSGLYAAHPAYRWGMAPYPLVVCGPSGCATVPVVDAGPDLASQRASRIVDLSPAAFRAICGPLSLGLCRVTVTGGTP